MAPGKTGRAAGGKSRRAKKGKTMEKAKFEIREIDAYAYDDGWIWNTSYQIGTFETSAKDERRAFTRALAAKGIRFLRGKTRIAFDGDLYEIVEKATGAPLFAAIPC